MNTYKILRDFGVFPDGTKHALKEPLTIDEHKKALENLDKASKGKAKCVIDELIRFGRRLFDQVFPKGHIFPDTIFIEVEDDVLHLLPWEFLHNGNGLLCLYHALCRVVKSPQVGLKPVEGRPLKVHVALSSPLLRYDPSTGPIPDEKNIFLLPEDCALPTVIDFRPEIRRFYKLENAHFPVDFHIHHRTSEIDFAELLVDEADVFHFTCHGNIGRLVGESKYGIEEIIDLESIHRIRSAKSYQMIVLSSCKTAIFKENFMENVAGMFLSKGIPAVIAMSRIISQDAGFLFTENLYRELSKYKHLPEALRKARGEIKDSTEIDPWEFGTPVLFLNKNLIKNDTLVLHNPEEDSKRNVRVIKKGGILREYREEKFAGRRRELVDIAKFLDREEGFDKKKELKTRREWKRLNSGSWLLTSLELY